MSDGTDSARRILGSAGEINPRINPGAEHPVFKHREIRAAAAAYV